MALVSNEKPLENEVRFRPAFVENKAPDVKEEDLSSQIRYGILGCAGISAKIARAIYLSPNSYVSLVASRTKTKGENFIAMHCPHARFATYDELIASDDVDIVYVPLPTNLRLSWVIKAIGNRKHVLCEKPVGVPKSVEVIMLSCRAKNVQFMDGISFMHHNRFKDLTVKVHKEKVIGDIQRVNASFSVPCLDDTNIRNTPQLEPLGVLGDLGIHCVRISMWAFDYQTPRFVKALCHRRNNKGALQDISAWLFFTHDRVAAFDCSYYSPLRQHVEVVGENGSINIREFVVPNERKCSYTTHYSSLNTYDSTETIKESIFENNIQELSMINRMSKNASSNKVESFWPMVTLMTEKIVDACRRSIDKDGQLVEFVKGQLWFEMSSKEANRRYSMVGSNQQVFENLNASVHTNIVKESQLKANKKK